MSLTRIPRYGGNVNAFLVAEDDGLTLVDTTMGGNGAAKANLEGGREARPPIVRIALTHAHQDHIGGLDALAERLPGVEVSISARDAKLLAKDMTPEPGEPADAKFRGGYPGAKTTPTRLLSPGDRVGSLEVVAAPGHTPGQIAVPRHARPHAPLRRRLFDARRRRDDRQGQPAVPAPGPRPGTPDRARDRPRAVTNAPPGEPFVATRDPGPPPHQPPLTFARAY